MATTKRTRTPKSKAPNSKAESVVTRPEVAKVTTQAVELNNVIRVRAYELFEQRGREHGRDFDDWLRAEGEVLARFGARTA
jgi:hypothetical protein